MWLVNEWNIHMWTSHIWMWLVNEWNIHMWLLHIWMWLVHEWNIYVWLLHIWIRQMWIFHLLCNTLQYTAARCNTLQHTATHCNTWQMWIFHSLWTSEIFTCERRTYDCDFLINEIFTCEHRTYEFVMNIWNIHMWTHIWVWLLNSHVNVAHMNMRQMWIFHPLWTSEMFIRYEHLKYSWTSYFTRLWQIKCQRLHLRHSSEIWKIQICEFHMKCEIFTSMTFIWKVKYSHM